MGGIHPYSSGGAYVNFLIRSNRSGSNRVDPVLREAGIAGDDGPAADHRLSDQHSVERISVVAWKASGG